MESPDPAIEEAVGYVEDLLRDMGVGPVAGALGDVEFALAVAMVTGGSSLVSLPDLPIAHTSKSVQSPGHYVAIELPRSLAVDLLLESSSGGATPSAGDSLDRFTWSATSETLLRRRIVGPLLDMLVEQDALRNVTLNDESLVIGPLPEQIGDAAFEVVRIIAAITSHFET